MGAALIRGRRLLIFLSQMRRLIEGGANSSKYGISYHFYSQRSFLKMSKHTKRQVKRYSFCFLSSMIITGVCGLFLDREDNTWARVDMEYPSE